MSVQCPLCLAANATRQEEFITAKLVAAYRHSLQMDIRGELAELETIGFYTCPNCQLKFFYPMAAGSGQFYDELQKFDWYYLEEKSEYDDASRFIKPDDRVLEIGCGSGVFAQRISSRNYIGLELSQRALAAASAKGLTVLNETIECHAEKNAANYYNVVCAFQVLEHIPDPHDFIVASVSCLKSGGLLVFSVPSADSFVSCDKNNLLNMPPHHVTWWHDACLKNMADIFGLKVVQIIHEPLSDIHRQWHAQTVTLKRLRQWANLKSVFLDASLQYKLLRKLATRIARFMPINNPSYIPLPRGHSVTVVYQHV